MAPTKGRQSTQQDYQLSRNYPVDKERAKGSCLVLPGSQRRKSRGKEEEQQRSLLGGESPASASTQLTAWTTTTETTQDDVSDMFSEDPFSVSKKQIEKERGSSVRRRGKKSSAVSHEELLMAPKPSERSRRKNYDGEQEPEGVRGQEAVVAKPLKQSPTSDTGDVLPGMRSFSEPSPRRSSNNDSLRLVSPEENKPSPRKSSRRHKDSIEDKQEYEVPDGRSPRLSLLPVTETSIPEGVEETSTEDDESSSHEGSLLKSSFVPDSKLVSVDEYSPQDVRDFRGSSVDIRKHSQGRPQSSSVSPPTPRMRKLPDGPERDRPSSTPSLVSASYSSDDLKEMMPDLMPIPQSSQVSTGRARSTSRHMGPGRLPGKESHSNDTFEANYINSLDHVEGMNAAAVEHVENGEYDLALAAFEQVLAAYKEIHGDAHPLVASTYHNLGMVHSKRAALLLDGTFHQNHCRQQSLECFQAAARSGRDSLGPNHPNVAVSLVRIGFLLLQARQYQNAFVTFKEALRIRLAHYGRESPHSLVANLYNNLGVCKMHMGEYKEGSSFLKTALEIQRKVLRIKRQEVNVSRNDLRNCLLEIADTLCNLGGLYLEWIRQQGPDPRNATEAESAFSEALEIRTTVLGTKHELVHQVRTLHDMARTTPLPAPLPDIDNEVDTPMRSRSGSRSRSRSRSVSVSQRDESDDESSPQLQRSSLEESNGLDRGFLQQSMASEGSQTRGISNIGREITPSLENQDDDFASLPVAQIAVDSLDQPSVDSNNVFRKSPLMSKSKDILHISADTKVRVAVAPYFIPRTSPPIEQPSEYVTGHQGSQSAEPRSSSHLINGLRDLSLDSAFERNGTEPSAYFAEESCLMGDIGGNSEKVDALFLSILTREDSFRADNSRTLSSHDITVMQPMDGGDTDSPLQTQSKRIGSMASFSRALAQQRRQKDVPSNVEIDTGKEYYDSPTVLLNRNGSMYAVDESDLSNSVRDPQSFFVDRGDNGLAPLGRDWDISRSEIKGRALTKDVLDHPEDNLDRIYDAAGRYLKRNQHREALHLFQIILDCQRRTYGELHADVGAAWHNVGVAFLRSERHRKALEAFERAVRVRKGSLGKEHPEVALSLVKVGMTQLLLQDFEMALLSFRDALAVRRRALGALHPSTARVYNNIGCVHMEFNDLPDARRAFEAALNIQRNALISEPTSGPLLFDTATTLCNLGYLYRVREMPERAALVLKEALSLQEHLLGPTHPTTMSTMDSLADVTAKGNDPGEALKYYKELHTRYHDVLKMKEGIRHNKRSGTEAILLYKLSRVHHIQRDYASELSELQKAVASIRSIDDVSMSSEERAEIDRLAALLLEDMKKCKTALLEGNLYYL